MMDADASLTPLASGALGPSPPASRWSAGERRLALASFLVAAALACPFFGHNENRTLDLLRALARGELAIDRDATNTVDRAFVPAAPSAAALELPLVAPASELRGGHFYAGGAPGTAFLVAPLYLATAPLPERLRDLVLVLAAGALPLALGAVAIRRAIARATGCTEEISLAAAAVFALGTIALPFATRLYGHELVVAFLAGGLALLLGDAGAGDGAPGSGKRPLGARAAALAGLCAGLAVACDYSAALPASALGVLALVRGGVRGGCLFALGASGPGAGLAWYHTRCFGSPLSTAYSHHADPSTRELLSSGALGFTWPRAAILLELVFGIRRGSLATQPAALVGLAGLAVALARPREERSRFALGLALATAVLVTLVHASRARDWHAGASFGPRYSIAALPFLALGLPRGLELLGKSARPLVATSIAIAVVGAATDWTYSVAGTFEALSRLGPRPRGLAVLVAGPLELGGATVPGVLASAVTLALALAVAAALLVREGRRTAIFGAIVGPLVACGPFLLFTGRTGARHAQALIAAHEDTRAIGDATDAPAARRMVYVARDHLAQLRDPALVPVVLAAVERLCALDPTDEEALGYRQELHRLLDANAHGRPGAGRGGR